ncbi:MAG: hypothetical protein PF518_02980 [Spirochaetaceae bacterium]|jgi:alpha-L-glutamate ligase-like protein|nr:hypothetical protein [Spirochaetaceae bacterium]
MKVIYGGLESITSLNKRNLDVISRYNKRTYFPIVDNKITTKEYLQKGNIPFPGTITIISNFFEIEKSLQILAPLDTFVVKPSKGRAGGGILLLEKKGENDWQTPSGRPFSRDELVKHFEDILFGVYSFGMLGDSVLIEKRVNPHKIFTDIYRKGVADIRIITFKNEPLMAMLRIPTDQSDGKANLHQGAIGVPVDLVSGITGNAMIKGKTIEKHPDTNSILAGNQIPFWEEIIQYAGIASNLIPLGYLGIDFVIDEKIGPLILELNARPGLQIQVINGKGLNPEIKRIEHDN